MRKALVEGMKCVYGVDASFSVDDVALTAGCNLAFVVAVMAIADAEDSVACAMVNDLNSLLLPFY